MCFFPSFFFIFASKSCKMCKTMENEILLVEIHNSEQHVKNVLGTLFLLFFLFCPLVCLLYSLFLHLDIMYLTKYFSFLSVFTKTPNIFFFREPWKCLLEPWASPPFTIPEKIIRFSLSFKIGFDLMNFGDFF